MKRKVTAEQYQHVITPSELRWISLIESHIKSLTGWRQDLCFERQALRNALWLRANKISAAFSDKGVTK